MGASGCGKSTVGAALGPPFTDGDALHPAANVAKMARGEPLTDEDRWPWLDAVGSVLASVGGVVACSALRRSYRARLLEACPSATFLYLAASRPLLASRLARRTGHFMPASLLDSQLATLEPLGAAEPGVTFSAALPVEQIVRLYRS